MKLIRIFVYLIAISIGLYAAPPTKLEHNLSNEQLHAVMSIITNFILNDDNISSTKPPVFGYTDAIVTAAENQTNVMTVHATDYGDTIRYDISGEDSAFFSIQHITGEITFNTAPNFETDQGTYRFTVTASDYLGNTSDLNVTVHISDVQEGTLKKTGQTISYNASGTEVIDGSIKDDGYYQKGVLSSYTRDDTSNIVTDHLTNLEWQDNTDVNVVSKPWLTAQNFQLCEGIYKPKDPSKCKDTSGDTATTYCSNLILGGHSDWRLPSVDELISLVDRSKSSPAISTVVFKNAVNPDLFWSSTPDSELTAWTVNFREGTVAPTAKGDVYSRYGTDYHNHHIRCVRHGQ